MRGGSSGERDTGEEYVWICRCGNCARQPTTHKTNARKGLQKHHANHCDHPPTGNEDTLDAGRVIDAWGPHRAAWAKRRLPWTSSQRPLPLPED